MRRIQSLVNRFRKPKGQLVAFSLIHVFIILLLSLINPYDATHITATGLYFDYASQLFQGAVPYRDFPLEYPPLALLFLGLPRLIGTNFVGYDICFTIEILIFDLLGLYLLFVVSRLRGLRYLTVFSVYTLSLLALWPIAIIRYDLIPAIMTLAAIYTFTRGKTKTSWALLAAGTMTKIFPIVLAPLFLLYSLFHRQYDRALKGVVTFALTTIAIALPLIVISPASLLQIVTYETERGLHVESIYASFLLAGHVLRSMVLSLELNFGSINITGSLADTLARISLPVLVSLLLIAYWYIFNTMKKVNRYSPLMSDDGIKGYLLNYSIFVILVLIVFNKVLSPQFLVWLYPLIPLIAEKWKYGLWGIFIAAAILTTYIFPYHYQGLLDLNTAEIAILVFRNILLVAMVIFLINRLRAIAPVDVRHG